MKCIAFDLDGTILNHAGKISKRTVDVLNDASSKGILLVCCTGRTYESAKSAIAPLHLEEKRSYFCGMNGQEILSFHDHHSYSKDPLNCHEVEIFVKSIKNKNVLAVLQKDDRMKIIHDEKKKWISSLYQQVCKYFWVYRQNDAYQQIDSVSLDRFVKESYAKVCYTGLPWSLKKLREQIQYDYPEQYTCVMVAPFWMECQRKEISKGAALQLIAEKEQIQLEEIIAFGDGENDISMLKIVGKGIAVKNAMRNVKKQASEICDTNQKDGVAKYLEKQLYR